jgi:hypothetical protein
MICLAGQLASFLEADRVYLALAFLGALGKAIVRANCWRLGQAELGNTPFLLQEKHIV